MGGSYSFQGFLAFDVTFLFKFSRLKYESKYGHSSQLRRVLVRRSNELWRDIEPKVVYKLFPASWKLAWWATETSQVHSRLEHGWKMDSKRFIFTFRRFSYFWRIRWGPCWSSRGNNNWATNNFNNVEQRSVHCFHIRTFIFDSFLDADSK